jgi:glycosyltransferase involved in cell wall biosynthesis
MEQPKTIFLLHPSDFLTDHEPHGDGLTAFGFIKELASRGYRLHVAVRQYSLRSQLPPNVVLHKVRTRVQLPLLDRLEYMIRVRSLFKRLQRQESIHLIHQMNPVFAGLSLAVAGMKTPIVLGTIVPRWPDDPDSVTTGSLLRGKVLQAVKNWIVNLQQKKATLLLLTSPAAMNRIPKSDQVQHKILFVPHGIDTESFVPAKTRRDANAPPTILYLANLQRRKGIFTLLEAFNDVAKAIPNCRLRIAGTGPEAKSISEYVRVMRYGGQVELSGNIEREKVGYYFRDCSVYCLPSFGEPFGATVVEAMSCGIPVVVTAAGGVPYLVPQDGGKLVPPGNPRGLAKALIEILANQELQSSMGAVNRNHVVASLSWSRVVDRLEVAYRIALLRHKTPATGVSNPAIVEKLQGDLLS